MSKARLFDLIHRLHRQYPVEEVTTNNPCPQCGEPARGADLCADCLVAEIEALTGDGYHPERYRTQLALQQWHLLEMLRRCADTERLEPASARELCAKSIESAQQAVLDRMVEEMRKTGADGIGEYGSRGRGGADLPTIQRNWARRWGREETR